MLKYGINTKGYIPVLLEGKKVGQIAQTPEGWQYTPKGHKEGGEKFERLEDCKASLETED